MGAVQVRLASDGFLSTPSARRATVDGPVSVQLVEFLSTPSARRATREISSLTRLCRISIHALREEGDVPGQHTGNSRTEFLSTPSARRATWSGRGRSFSSYISIHALREEGDEVATNGY